MNKIFISLILFFFILAPRLNLSFQIHTGFITVLLIFLFNYKNSIKALRSKENIYFISFLFFLIVYHFCLAINYGNDYSQFILILSSLTLYTIFSFAISSYFYQRDEEYKSVVDLIHLVVIIVFVNSLLILFEFQYPDFKIYLETLLVNDGTTNINYIDHPFRLRGLASSGGASLSMLNAAIIWFCVVLAKRGHINISFAFVILLIINLSNIFTGRTGLIYGIIFSIYFLLFVYVKNVFQKPRIFIRDSLICIFILIYLPNIEINDEIISWAFEWTNVFKSGIFSTNSSDDLKQMIFIPDNIFHFLFGIGFFEGTNDYYPRTDSGYLKTLLSLGFLISLIFYIILFVKIIKITKINNKLRMLFYPVIILLLISEVKEPFIYQNYLSRTIFIFIGLATYIRYENNRNDKINILRN